MRMQQLHSRKTTCGIIDSIKRSIAKDCVKALMSLGDVWKQAFDDWVGEVHPHYTQQCNHIGVLNDGVVKVVQQIET